MFSVEPWEVESDEVDFLSPQIAEWQNEAWELVLARDHQKKVLCFRREGGPLLRDMRRFKKRGEMPATQRMKPRFIECMETNSWKRELFLNRAFTLRQSHEETSCSIALASDGNGCIHHGTLRDVPFKCQAQDYSRLGVGELLSLLEDEEDFRYARRFKSLSRRKVWDEMWLWKRGDDEELRQILTLALMAQGETDKVILRLDLLDDSQEERYLYVAIEGFVLCGEAERRDLTPALEEAVETVLAWFGPHINTANVEAHPCLIQLVMPGTWTIETQPNPPNPTAHERVEAAVKWREWLASTQL